MRPIPAPRIGDSHGLMRAIDQRERLRLEEFVTEFAAGELYPPHLENALGRTRQFLSFARAAGLVREDRGVVELTEIGRRYIRAGDVDKPFDVSPGQAEWLRGQLREKHMTDSIYHGLAIGLSLLSSSPGARVSTLDFGRALSYLGRAGWDNENTLQIQGERHLALLRDMALIDEQRGLTAEGAQTRGELTLPIHMSLTDLAAQLNPGGAEAVRRAGEAEWGAAEPAPAEPDRAAAAPAEVAAPTPADDDEYQDVGPGAWVDPGRPTTGTVTAVPPAPEPAPPAPELAPAPAPEPAPPPPPESAPAPAPAPPPAAEPISAAPVPDAAPAEREPAVAAAVSRDTFIAGSAIRAAAAARGLRLPDSTFANLAAALARRHVVLVGPPACGKTELALAVAAAATDAGKATGTTLVVGADEDQVVAAAHAGRWLVIDELAQAPAPSALLAGHPVTTGDGEIAVPAGWRIVATAASVPEDLGSRFAVVEVGDHPDLAAAIDAQARDATAAAAVRRLLPLRELAPLGAGPFLAGAAHAAARRAEAPADEATLAREVYTAYLAPLLDPAAAARARELVP